MHSAEDDGEQAIARTRRWVERAVIGLQLCPFAGAVQGQGRAHYSVSPARGHRDLLEDLGRELERLDVMPARERETTLLIAPHAMQDFIEFALFLPAAEKLLRDRRLDGSYQVASFHPGYVFSDLDADDPANCSNRSPYPTLQLLRQASVGAVMRGESDAEAIFSANIERLRDLGMDGWRALDVGPPR